MVGILRALDAADGDRLADGDIAGRIASSRCIARGRLGVVRPVRPVEVVEGGTRRGGGRLENGELAVLRGRKAAPYLRLVEKRGGAVEGGAAARRDAAHLGGVEEVPFHFRKFYAGTLQNSARTIERTVQYCTTVRDRSVLYCTVQYFTAVDKVLGIKYWVRLLKVRPAKLAGHPHSAQLGGNCSTLTLYFMLLFGQTCAFSGCAHVAFGTIHEDFSSFAAAIGTCFGLFMGETGVHYDMAESEMSTQWYFFYLSYAAAVFHPSQHTSCTLLDDEPSRAGYSAPSKLAILAIKMGRRLGIRHALV